MTRTPFRRTAAALTSLALAGALAACGGDEPEAAPVGETTTSASPTESPTETASEAQEPTDGDRIAGQGYIYGLPEGWEDGTERFQALSPLLDTGAYDSDGSSGFSDNVNVIRNDSFPEMGLEEAEQQFGAEASTVSEDVQVRDRSEIGGETAIHISGRTAAGKAKVRTEQYSLYREDAWYIVTFSFGEDTPDASMDADVTTVLGSWQWE